MKELTEDQAIQIAKSGIWNAWNDYEKVQFQLFTPRICMPLDIFHDAMGKVMNRQVFHHEYMDIESLQKEFLGEKEAPTFEEICQLIPEEKRIIVKL